jgi:putative two-component system response regulator
MSMTDPRPRVLVVDDEPINVKILIELLRATYTVVVATNGEQALQRLQPETLPDIVLLDVMMPALDGLEVCRRIKAEPRLAELPVIFVTSLGDAYDETRGFELGAVDYITKPFSPPVVLARLRTHLELCAARRALAARNKSLEEAVAQRTREVVLTQDVTIRALASLAEARDNETGNHVKRTQHYVRRLAEEMRHHPRFVEHLTDRSIDLMFKSAPLHDIGKVGIPDAILLKPGKLTPEEFEIMKTHAALGERALLAAVEDGAAPTDFLRYAVEISGSHHEKWDGSGYPAGLAGEAIPVSARLMAVADVYDALICRRVYKKAFSHEAAVALIEEGSGKHFDPAIVAGFLRCVEDFRAISGVWADPPET